MSIIKLNDLKSTEIDTDNLLAVCTDMREFVNNAGLLEYQCVIDCELKKKEHIALQYDYSALADCQQDFELLANLEHVTVYFK